MWMLPFGNVPEIDAGSLHEIILSDGSESDPPLLIDVRTDGEYCHGHITKAVNASFIPPWSFADRVQPVIKDVPTERDIVVICLSAHRSVGAVKWLQQRGYKKAVQLKGGMQAWHGARLPVVR